MSRRRTVWIALAVILIAAAAIVAALLLRSGGDATDNVADDRVKAADAGRPDPQAVARGKAIAIAADCAACHTRPGSNDAYAGGYAIETPFGAIVSPNITPERRSGIGDWTERDFFRAVRHGRSPSGLLYPAMPYTAYVQIDDADMHDLWAYVRSLKPLASDSGGTHLPFPFNIRLLMAGWNMLFFDNRPFKADPGKPADWNRGRYLVDALGHCAACHTPKNMLGGDRRGRYLEGGALQGWFAPELSGNAAHGLGSWNDADLVAYLRSGSNGQAVAAGPMAEAVERSTQFMPDADLAAMSTYLKSLPGSNAVGGEPLAATSDTMTRGAHVYVASCSGCHAPGGEGIAGMATRLANNPAIRAPDPSSLIHVVLKGGRAAATVANPTGAGMPAFAWKLSDDDAAAVLTFVRNSWGNAAAPVTAAQIAAARKARHARQPM